MRRTILAVVLLAACADREAPAPSPAGEPAAAPTATAPSAPVAPVDPAKRGAAIVGELKRSLIGALTQAMATGPASAIEVCNVEAPRLAGALSTDGVKVGRATTRPRNPNNRATGWQADAIAHFESLKAAGTPLGGQTFVRTMEDGTTAYAEPLVIQALCTACHGTELAPDVVEVLASRYPADQATGYREGDLRGVAWVELPPAR